MSTLREFRERSKRLDELLYSIEMQLAHLDPRTDDCEIERLTAERDAARLAFHDLRQREQRPMR